MNTVIFAVQGGGEFRYLKLGNNAFKNDDYESALRFYRKFYENSAGHARMREKATGCIARCAIKLGNSQEAEKSLQLLEKNCSDSNENRLLRAQLKIFLGQYPAAQSLLTRTISNKIVAGEIYYQMLDGLGYCYLKRRMRPEALETYKLLEKAAIGSKYEFIAYRQIVYTLIIQGKFKQAEAKLAEGREWSGKALVAQIEALKLFLYLQQNSLEYFRKSAPKFFSAQTPHKNTLFNEVCETAAKAFELKKDYIFAAEMRLNAFRFAATAKAGKNNFLIRIKDLVLAGERQQAVAASLLFAERFRGSAEALKVKFVAADMMDELGLHDDALALYGKISKDSIYALAARAKATLCAAKILIKQKKYKEAEEFISLLDKESSKLGDAEKGEMQYLRAEILFAQGHYAESGLAFRKCAKEHKTWHDKGRFQYLMCLLKQKKYPEAVKEADYLMLKSRAPAALEAQYFKALALDRNNNTLEAQKIYAEFASKNPAQKYAPNALFRAGQIAYGAKDYKRAIGCFGEFEKKYPASYYAANSCYRALLCAIALKDEKLMEKYSALLEQKYSESIFAPGGLFALLDIYRENKQFKSAHALLKRLSLRFKEKKLIIERIELEKVQLLADENKLAEALAQSKKFIKMYSDSSLYSQAMLLSGDLASQSGDYAAAGSYYLLGAERKDGSDIALVCLGRYADCNFILYSRKFDRKFLKKAVNAYKKLLDDSKMPALLRNQSLYKLGRCSELLKNDPAAMNYYLEVIYGVNSETLNQSETLWLVKCAHRAIMLYLKHGGKKNIQKALLICRVLEDLNIDMGEDIDKLREQIRKLGIAGSSNKRKKSN